MKIMNKYCFSSLVFFSFTTNIFAGLILPQHPKNTAQKKTSPTPLVKCESSRKSDRSFTSCSQSFQKETKEPPKEIVSNDIPALSDVNNIDYIKAAKESSVEMLIKASTKYKEGVITKDQYIEVALQVSQMADYYNKAKGKPAFGSIGVAGISEIHEALDKKIVEQEKKSSVSAKAPPSCSSGKEVLNEKYNICVPIYESGCNGNFTLVSGGSCESSNPHFQFSVVDNTPNDQKKASPSCSSGKEVLNEKYNICVPKYASGCNGNFTFVSPNECESKEHYFRFGVLDYSSL